MFIAIWYILHLLYPLKNAKMDLEYVDLKNWSLFPGLFFNTENIFERSDFLIFSPKKQSMS